jgi:hypothetical protein
MTSPSLSRPSPTSSPPRHPNSETRSSPARSTLSAASLSCRRCRRINKPRQSSRLSRFVLLSGVLSLSPFRFPGPRPVDADEIADSSAVTASSPGRLAPLPRLCPPRRRPTAVPFAPFRFVCDRTFAPLASDKTSSTCVLYSRLRFGSKPCRSDRRERYSSFDFDDDDDDDAGNSNTSDRPYNDSAVTNRRQLTLLPPRRQHPHLLLYPLRSHFVRRLGP